ncbi:MAG TPA: hypothetical protein O0Y02_02440 [Methanocorpusculum sp.]|nr:hypothetical protein [Methanocorpusculum sp.]
MRLYQLLCAVVVCMFMAVPAAGVSELSLPLLSNTDSSLEKQVVLPNGENRFGYLYVSSVEYVMKNSDAEITVRYQIEPWISFLVYLFGKQDLKKRVLGILGYPEAGYESVQDVSFSYIDGDYAVLKGRNAALDNQDNSYWIRPHSFGCVIPTLTFVISSSDIKTFTNVKDMSKGIGFFKS